MEILIFCDVVTHMNKAFLCNMYFDGLLGLNVMGDS